MIVAGIALKDQVDLISRMVSLEVIAKSYEIIPGESNKILGVWRAVE